MKLIQSLLPVFLIFSFFSFSQQDSSFQKVDSLLKIKQPGAAQKELWKIFKRAQKENNLISMVKAIPYFQQTLSPLEAKERVAIYFRLQEKTQDLEEPAQSLVQIELLQELIYNTARWSFHQPLAIYDSLEVDLSTREKRLQWGLRKIEKLQNKLPDLQKYAFQPYEKELLKGNDSLHISRTVSDFVAYQLVELYSSNLIRNRGSLKKSRDSKREWYATSNQFVSQNLDANNLTNKMLWLYQFIEKNNQNYPPFLSVAVYQRLEFLKENFKKEGWLSKAWREEFQYFKNSSARSKFLLRIAREKYEKGLKYHYIKYPTVEKKIKEAYDLLQTEIQKYPKSNFNGEIRALIALLQKKEIKITLPTLIPLDTKIPLLVQYRNISHKVLSIYKIEGYDPLDILSLRSYATNGNIALIRTQRIELKTTGMFQKRGDEFLLEGISKSGHYIFVFSDKKLKWGELTKNDTAWKEADFICEYINVSSISITTTRFNNQYTVLVVNQKTGRPRSNAEVILYYENHPYDGNKNWHVLKKGKTNDKGLYVASVEESKYIKSVVKYKESVVFEKDYSYSKREATKHQSIRLLTDRSIYRPGQTVYFKGIVYSGKENEFQVVANHKIIIELKDANHQSIYKHTYTTNEFGSVDGAIQLPQQLALGYFTLRARGKRFSTIRFKVEEYKRPTFGINLNSPKNRAKLKDTVTVTGDVMAFAGYPISNAKVTYSVYRRWNRYWRSYFNNSSGADLLETGAVRTSQDGKFSLNFFASTDPNAVKGAYYYYQIKAKITGISGETHEESITLRLNRTGLALKIEMQQKMFMNEDGNAVFQVVNLAGKTQDNYSGVINVYQNQNPDRFLERIWENPEYSHISMEKLQEMFPYRKFNSFSKEPKKVLIKSIPFSGGDTLSIKNLLNKKQGEFQIQAFVVTKNGDTIKANQTIKIIDVKRKNLPENTSLWSFLSSKDPKVGEKINFQVGSSFPNAKALLTVYRRNEILEQKWIDLKNRYSYYYTIQEEDRGEVVTFDALLFYNGEFYPNRKRITVPMDNKVLEIKTSTFTDKLLPGQKERWSFTISNFKNKLVKAELAATMYDASLDQFVGHLWRLWPYNTGYNYRVWETHPRFVSLGNGFSHYNSMYFLGRNKYRKVIRAQRPSPLNSLYLFDRGAVQYRVSSIGRTVKKSLIASPESSPRSVNREESKVSEEEESTSSPSKEEKNISFQPRSNFKETAFFYPTIYANDSNKYVVNFTLPESLTEWKLLLLAHTKDMQIGTLQKKIIAQKELMITVNAPRFVREGDKITFPAKVINLTDTKQIVEVSLDLSNPITGDTLSDLTTDQLKKIITVPANSSQQVEWQLTIGNSSLIQYTIRASTNDFRDGERNILPVLRNRILVTEAKHKLIREPGTTTLTFEKLAQNDSKTLRNVSYTVKYTDNLAWSAILALPYLSKENNQSTTGLMNQYYANAIASKILEEHPKIKIIFNRWKEETPEMLWSELQKNKELKSIILKETPWVAEAKSEEEQRQRIAQLFNLNQLQDNQMGLWRELQNRQNSDGGFSWFLGGYSNVYITQSILTQIGHLQRLGIDVASFSGIVEEAAKFLGEEQVQFYRNFVREDKENYQLRSTDVQWLYVRSLFDFSSSKGADSVAYFYREELKTDWTDFPIYLQALIGIYFKDQNKDKYANLIYASLQDRAHKDTPLGMYWVENSGYYWYQNKIATQAMVISFFQRMDAPQKIMDNARFWLLLNKQGQMWKTGKETANAIYAILSTGRNYLAETKKPKITVGNQKLITAGSPKENDVKVEWVPGVGAIKHKWVGEEIQPGKGVVTIEKRSTSPSAVSIIWQYTEELSKIQSDEDGYLSVKKKYFRVIPGKKGEKLVPTASFKIGDKIKIVLTITSHRDMEFIHVKDLRPAGFEPAKTLSGYHWKQRLSYYQSPRDASMNYFIESMSKGRYKLSYYVYATHGGEFNSGTTSIQCFYAPEYVGHSSTMEVEIE